MKAIYWPKVSGILQSRFEAMYWEVSLSFRTISDIHAHAGLGKGQKLKGIKSGN